MLIGYMRVSSKSQDAANGDARQRAALIKYGVDEENLYYDVMTGRSASRPALDEMMNFIRKGDTVVCSELSRLGRNTKNCLELIEEFKQKGVNFVAIKEGIDLSTPMGEFFLTICSAFNELELSYINDRAAQGREAARNSGRNCGGRPKKNEKELSKALSLFAENSMSVREITEQTGVSASLIYREAKSRGITRK